MPEVSHHKDRLHPSKAPSVDVIRSGSCVAYTELQVTTNFTFLAGASHAEELAIRAAQLGHRAIAITDTNSLAGVVRAYGAAKQVGLPLVVGCRLVFTDTSVQVLVYPTDLPSYSRLCRMLTRGKRIAPKSECHLTVHDLIEHEEGLLPVVVPPAVVDDDAIDVLQGLRDTFRGRLSIAASRPYGPDDRDHLRRLADLAEHLRTSLVATNDVRYHVPERQPLHDVLTCIRLGCTLEEAGTRLLANPHRCLKPPEEMARLFADYPKAIARTMEIVEQAQGFTLDSLRYQYPSEVVPPGRSPMQHLAELTWAGARGRYSASASGGGGDGVPDKVRGQIEHELRLIDELGFAHYFLTVEDLVRFARGAGILCQGRGAAANSAVCYCLGVTSVDPSKIDVLFERFVSRERNEPPDIDIDFEHERREEVIQYIYRKYGRDRAALTAEVITYRGRSAVREVGKALGLGLDTVDRLSKTMNWWGGTEPDPAELRKLGLDPSDRTIRHLLHLTREIQGFPRHLSQHVGGFVITQSPLCELVPIENAAMDDRTVIEWDKDDIDAVGMMKVDVLGLGMLTCLRKCFDEAERHHGEKLTLATIPPEDPKTYSMIRKADTLGVFQIESRAQMSMLPRLRPKAFYDLVVQVAIVRPGPIQGDMVHPYLRRRCGDEPVTYPDPRVERILKKTLGVPLFQEQAMQMAIDCAGFTADEADALRRAVTGFHRYGDIDTFRDKFIGGMLHRGYAADFADRCFRQIQGFSTYGFPESHSASFALLAYASTYLKRHYPEAFACALLNSQPMGFYAPAQIVRDAQEHGVTVRPVDVNRSDWDCSIEPDGALRLGMRMVRGMREDEADAIVEAVRQHGAFEEMETLWRTSGVRVTALRALGAADAFGSMGLDRQAAIWACRKLRDVDAPLFDAVRPAADRIPLPTIAPPQKVRHDYRATGLSLRAHPLSFLREALAERGVSPAALLKDPSKLPNHKPATVAGLCLVRQRPGSAKGITFMTIEDETGIANLIVRPRIYERHRAAMAAGAIIAQGHVERQGEVVHLVVHRAWPLNAEASAVDVQPRNFR